MDRSIGARGIVHAQGHARFISQVFASKGSDLAQPFPKLERFALSSAGKKTADGADRLGLARLQTIGGGRLIARVAPFLLIDKGESMFRVPARLPAANRISNRPCHEETDYGKN